MTTQFELLEMDAPLKINAAHATILYRQAFLPLDKSQEIFDTLQKDVSWRHEKITVWGKTHNQPRLVAWYGDAGKSYSYSGIVLRPLPWLPLLHELKQSVEEASGAKFNSVLLNQYRDQFDSMGFHSDDEPELGPTPTIASLSFGEKRTLIFKPSNEGYGKTFRVPLESGSLLMMAGSTQKYWKHGIEKMRAPCGPRINLTFRYIYQ